jgi:hypothetical protein
LLHLFIKVRTRRIDFPRRLRYISAVLFQLGQQAVPLFKKEADAGSKGTPGKVSDTLTDVVSFGNLSLGQEKNIVIAEVIEPENGIFRNRTETNPPVKRQETLVEDIMPLPLPKSVPTLEAFFDAIKKIIAPAPKKPEAEAIVPRGGNAASPDA